LGCCASKIHFLHCASLGSGHTLQGDILLQALSTVIYRLLDSPIGINFDGLHPESWQNSLFDSEIVFDQGTDGIR